MYLELGQQWKNWRVGIETNWQWGMILYSEDNGHMPYTMFKWGFVYYIRNRRKIDEFIETKEKGNMKAFLEWYDCKTEEEWLEKYKDYK